jgi:RNA polymerase sigma-70 factor, ECF subfamily
LTDRQPEWESHEVAVASSVGRGPPGDARDALELAALYRSHAAFVWRGLHRLGVVGADADDALQEVFLVVARRLPEYTERGAMRAWLFRIARQVAMHARRGHVRRQRREQELLLHESEGPPDPQRALEQKQDVALVEGLLDRLEPEQGIVLYLADVEGFSVPEIAAALAVPLNTVYGRLRLARARFETLLRQHVSRTGGRP